MTTDTRPVMTAAELREHHVADYRRDYNESDDGYSDMEAEEGRGWRALPSWGRDGWDLGKWPYVVLYKRERDDKPRFELMAICEGHEPVQGSVLRPPPGHDFRPPHPDVLRHVGVRHFGVMLIAEPLVDPRGGVPLLTRRIQVSRKIASIHPVTGVPHRSRSRRRLAPRRLRRPDRLPHGAPG
jgi:hypothetical protein